MTDDPRLLPPPSSAPRPLGNSGLDVSPIGWGMWRVSDLPTADLRAAIDAALESGITLFDTADVYGYGEPGGFGTAEARLGAAFAEASGLRDGIVLATKGGVWLPGPYDSSAAHLTAALDASLARLRTDRIDLYQVHRRDLLTHPQEVAAALDGFVASGKIRAVGVSNYLPHEVDALRRFLSVPLVSTQPEFSPLHSDALFDGTLDQAMAENVGVLAWSPLGGGRLATGDHPAGQLLAAHAARFDADLAAAALSWIMAHPARIIPLIGTTNPARIAASKDAMRIRWSRAEWYAVLQAGMGKALP